MIIVSRYYRHTIFSSLIIILVISGNLNTLNWQGKIFTKWLSSQERRENLGIFGFICINSFWKCFCICISNFVYAAFAFVYVAFVLGAVVFVFAFATFPTSLVLQGSNHFEGDIGDSVFPFARWLAPNCNHLTRGD